MENRDTSSKPLSLSSLLELSSNSSSSSSKATQVCQLSDLLVFSHLRWDFVFQRPQHLLTRFAKFRRVFYFEEPIFTDVSVPVLHESPRDNHLSIMTPHLPHGMTSEDIRLAQQALIEEAIEAKSVKHFTSWYYTPEALPFTKNLEPDVVIYDCMDELSAFKFAPASLLENEAELLRRADVVYTGGQSLYEAKKDRHHNVLACPSSIDRAHFEQARTISYEAPDQSIAKGPKIGFFGVIDERMDLELLAGAADLRPEWNFMMIGPVVKVELEDLPRRSNIHYLGKKEYSELPVYLSGWDVAILPFAMNESTRFISPTKTPEYLAAGCPVVSTPIRDVVNPYEKEKLVFIAEDVPQFVAAIEKALVLKEKDQTWATRVDKFLSQISWEHTWQKMAKAEQLAKSEKSNFNQSRGSRNLSESPTTAVHGLS